MIYLFFDENTLESFYKFKLYEGIKTKSLINFLYDFINILLNIYVDVFKKKYQLQQIILMKMMKKKLDI